MSALSVRDMLVSFLCVVGGCEGRVEMGGKSGLGGGDGGDVVVS